MTRAAQCTLDSLGRTFVARLSVSKLYPVHGLGHYTIILLFDTTKSKLDHSLVEHLKYHNELKSEVMSHHMPQVISHHMLYTMSCHIPCHVTSQVMSQIMLQYVRRHDASSCQIVKTQWRYIRVGLSK